MTPHRPGLRRPVALHEPDHAIGTKPRHFLFPMALCKAVDHPGNVDALSARSRPFERFALFAVLLCPVDHIYPLSF